MSLSQSTMRNIPDHHGLTDLCSIFLCVGLSQCALSLLYHTLLCLTWLPLCPPLVSNCLRCFCQLFKPTVGLWQIVFSHADFWSLVLALFLRWSSRVYDTNYSWTFICVWVLFEIITSVLFSENLDVCFASGHIVPMDLFLICLVFSIMSYFCLKCLDSSTGSGENIMFACQKVAFVYYYSMCSVCLWCLWKIDFFLVFFFFFLLSK